jgi:DNA-binding CsgD family transcriptional regulator
VCLAALAIFSLIAVFTFQAPNAPAFRVFFLISIAGLFLFYPATLDFAYRLSLRHRMPSRMRVLVYVPPLAFYLASLLGYNVPFGGYHYAPGLWWVFEPQIDPFWIISYAGYGLTVMGLTVLLLVRFYRRTWSIRERRQAVTVLTGIAVSTMLQWGEFLVLPRVLPWEVPSLTPILAVPWIVGMYVAVQRYNLLDLSPEQIVEEAFDSVTQGIVLIDTTGSVTYHNREAAAILGAPSLMDGALVATVPAIGRWVKNDRPAVRGLDQGDGAFQVVHRSRDGQVLSLGRPVSDRFGDCLGYVAFLHRPPDDRALQCNYGLSEREIEVYRELLTGQTLKEIASRLGITERTVKAHVHSLYEKTGADNRTELVATAWSIDFRS